MVAKERHLGWDGDHVGKLLALRAAVRILASRAAKSATGSTTGLPALSPIGTLGVCGQHLRELELQTVDADGWHRRHSRRCHDDADFVRLPAELTLEFVDTKFQLHRELPQFCESFAMNRTLPAWSMPPELPNEECR